MKEMRRKGILITPQCLDYFCKKGKFEILDSPIPKNAKFISSYYDEERMSFVVIFEHSSFEPIPERGSMPVFEDIRTQITLRKIR